MNEPDEYVFTQNAIASDFASTYPSLKSTTYFDAFSHVIYLRKLHRIILCEADFAFHAYSCDF